MDKNRHIISELQQFFANNDASKAINSISTIMSSIRIQSKVIGSVKNPNCKFTSLQVLLVLIPFFSVKNAANHSSSALSRMLACHKDMSYRFINDGNVNWRRIIYSVFRQLYSRVSRKTTSKSDIKCAIIDDTDIPKTVSKPILATRRCVSVLQTACLSLFMTFLFTEKRGTRSYKPEGLSKKTSRYSL